MLMVEHGTGRGGGGDKSRKELILHFVELN